MDRFKLFKNDQHVIRKRTPVQSQSAWTCKICKTNSAKYTCPRCNLPYCSLDCYKSENHGECTESFYKDCVLENLKKQNVSDQTKKKMEDTLKKMFDEAADQTDIPGMENPEDLSADLAERLEGVDLDRDYEKLWDCLTEEEKKEFEQFVGSGNLSDVIEPWEPWWMTEIIHAKIVEVGVSDTPSNRQDIPLIRDPPDLTSLFQRHPPAPSVAYSCVNLLYSYVLICRIYNGDHLENAESAAENLLEISAGLRSDRILGSIEEAIIVATIEADASSVRTLVESRELKSSAMSDVLRILKDLTFIQAGLSDVISLLKKAWKVSPKKKEFASSFKKVEYFLAYVEGHVEVLMRFSSLIQQQQAEFIQATIEQNTVRSAATPTSSSRRKPLIQEL